MFGSITKVAAVAGPYVKVIVPVVFAGVSGVVGAISKQQEQLRINNMEKDIEALKALLNK